jgi:hypothetical protein
MQPKERPRLWAAIAAAILGMLIWIAVMALNDFPAPPQGSADKSEAPPEDARG